jgi:hypothetical protein
MDTDSENQAAREAAMGGYLGVGELFARADKFANFARRLNDGYGGEEGLAATKKELVRRKEDLARLRKTVAETNCNSLELVELTQSDISAALLVLDEIDENKPTTRLHGDSPEIRLAELKVRSALDSWEQRRQLHSLEEVVGKIEEKVSRISGKRDQALEAARLFRGKANLFCAEQLDRLFDVVSPLFSRVQANEVFDSLHRGPQRNPFDWVAKSSSYEFTPSPHFSMGQRQDLALAIFMARARGVKGTFFLDEPVIHLDDLNRVALMDTFRMLVLESEQCCNFVMTTARRDFVRHMAEKFTNAPPVQGLPPLRIYELDGSPRVGVRVAKEWCAGVR